MFVSPPRRILCANCFTSLSRRLSLQEGKDKGVATLTASADSSIFLRVFTELALPLGRNRHLVNSLARVHALSFPDVCPLHLLL